MTVTTIGDLLGNYRAEWSECEVYRYTLERYWAGAEKPCVFLMLNPATATETYNDRTNTRTLDFGHRWGHPGVIAVNLFAFRATDPNDMKAAAEPVGPENDEVLKRIVSRAGELVFAWGVHGVHRDRDLEVVELLRGIGPPPKCLGFSLDGHPYHPLMIPAVRKLVPFVPREGRS